MSFNKDSDFVWDDETFNKVRESLESPAVEVPDWAVDSPENFDKWLTENFKDE